MLPPERTGVVGESAKHPTSTKFPDPPTLVGAAEGVEEVVREVEVEVVVNVGGPAVVELLVVGRLCAVVELLVVGRLCAVVELLVIGRLCAVDELLVVGDETGGGGGGAEVGPVEPSQALFPHIWPALQALQRAPTEHWMLGKLQHTASEV